MVGGVAKMMINMGRVFKQIALGFSDRAALVNVERNRRFTFGEMLDLSNRISGFLQYMFGLSEGDIYATILENDNMGLFHPWMLRSSTTALWIDIRESLDEQLKQIDFAQPRLIFIEEHFLPQLYEHLRERGTTIVSMDKTKETWEGVYHFWDLVEEAPSREVAAEFVADDVQQHISLLRFTGGTTGRPKCAMYSLSNLWTWGCNPAHYYETLPYDHPRAMLFSPIGHAASGSVVIPVLVKGGTLVTMNKADIERIGQNIARERINMIYTVPTVLYRILDMDLPTRYDLSSLKTIRYGGSPISPAKLKRLLEEFGRLFVQGYGSTECWPSCTILARKDHGVDSDTQIRRLSSVGRPMPGQEVLVCDDDGREVPGGQKGELYIRGPNTVQGYYNAPMLTRENFTENGFWKSGDIGFMDEEGYVYLVDRKDDMIITGGYNVYPTEVENCLNSHAGVENSAVVGVPDETWGEAVCGVVVLRKGQVITQEELIGHCKQHLARYKAPKRIVIADALPLSAVGKVLRRDVRRKFFGAF
jgi:acyl-CoA synthetase (AMP-forming)/AMP-acid ligase II